MRRVQGTSLRVSAAARLTCRLRATLSPSSSTQTVSAPRRCRLSSHARGTANYLSDLPLQNFTAWTNLSEAVFVCKPTDERAHYRLRIFDPTRELPFAGHPTLGVCVPISQRRFLLSAFASPTMTCGATMRLLAGACHAWLARGARGDGVDGGEVIRQECGIGKLVPK
jgi:hypothetical protein